MIILCDADGVLADFVGRLCECLKDGTKPAHVNDWELKDSLGEEKAARCFEIMHEPGFVSGILPYTFASDFVVALRAFGDVYCVTAPFPSKHWMYERLMWLRRTMGFASSHILKVNGPQKHLIRGDVMIEDHPRNLAAWLDANPEGLGILMDRPWNQEGSKAFVDHDRMCRVAGFSEAWALIESASND